MVVPGPRADAATLASVLLYRAGLIAELRTRGIWEHDALDALKQEIDRVNSQIAALIEAIGAVVEER